MDIETLLSDFRKMAESLKHFRIELLWCEPENGNVVYVYRWCVLLGIFNLERSSQAGEYYTQIKDFDYWKLCLQAYIEEEIETSLCADTETFCEGMRQDVQEMQRDTEKIEEWLKQHPEIPWYRIEDEEEESDVED